MSNYTQYNLPAPVDDYYNPNVLNSFALGDIVQPTSSTTGSLDANSLTPQVSFTPTVVQTFIMGSLGILSFGDGSDGDVTISADTTLTSDMYYKNLTINSGKVLTIGQYRIFVSEELNCYGSIKQDGVNGTDAVGITKGTGGALTAGYFTSSTGGDGAQGNSLGSAGTAGSNGANKANALASANGAAGGNGGTGQGGTSAGGGGGSGGTTTQRNTKLTTGWHLGEMLDVAASGSTVKYENSAETGGGGAGGSGGGGQESGGGGGGGSRGGIGYMSVKRLLLYPTSALSFRGGNGGVGGAGGGNSGGGGGGAAGNGGILVMIYNELVNNSNLSLANLINLVAGSVGAGGAKAGTGVNGQSGNAGTAGVLFTFQVSM